MLPEITKKTRMNVNLTGKLIAKEGLEYEAFDIEGHLMLNRVFK